MNVLDCIGEFIENANETELNKIYALIKSLSSNEDVREYLRINETIMGKLKEKKRNKIK